MSVTRQQNFEEMTCPECRIVWYVPADLMDSARRNAGSYTCPNGHKCTFLLTAAERERNELRETVSKHVIAIEAREQRILGLLDDRARLESRCRIYRGQITRLRKRLGIWKP